MDELDDYYQQKSPYGRSFNFDSENLPNKPSSSKTVLIIVSITVTILLILAIGLIPFQETKILSVSHLPDSPQADDEIKIIAEITGGSLFFGPNARCEYASYFNGSSSGGGTMSSIGTNMYSYKLHSPYEEGTEVWYMIQAGDKISESYTFQVGHVERSNISTLSITNVVQEPINPTTETDSVLITADISSNAEIVDVDKMYNAFLPTGTSGGSSSGRHSGDDTYNFSIKLSKGGYLMPGDEEPYPKGTKVYYRIAAKDELGNTAVTPTYSFTIN
jgi:hypothetical protein